MRAYVIAYDLGTGGCKASIYDANGSCVDECFTQYGTYYSGSAIHEQKPAEWWQAICDSTRQLLENNESGVRTAIRAIGISGHSLGLVPLDRHSNLLLESVPIWSDSRPEREDLDPFFDTVLEEEWYNITGNGFPAPLYTIFKTLWLKRKHPQIFKQIDTILGTKDYINYLLTGVIATDNSYASGCGIYSLADRKYSNALIDAAAVPRSIFPDITASDSVIGTLRPEIADLLGLQQDVQVVAGGVDNSCMALGAACYKEGDVYNSLGSSSWIAVSSSKPLLNSKTRPFVFDHVVPGQYVSATSIFSAGSSYRWFQEQLCRDMDPENIYEILDTLAASVPAGSENLIFNPNLAGGSSLDESPHTRGGFLGLSLSHSRAHMARSVMEGIAFGLRVALEELQKMTEVNGKMVMVGGGSKSRFWRQIFADIYGIPIIKTNIDQQAAALGAAALALNGAGIQNGYSFVEECHTLSDVSQPAHETKEVYNRIYPLFKQSSSFLSTLGQKITTP